MIEMYTGKPGAGKSYALTREVTLALPEGDWGVVTNLPLNLKALENYYLKPGRIWQDVRARVRLISDEETGEFWRFTPWFTIVPGGSCRNRRKYEAYLEVKRRGSKLTQEAAKSLDEFAVESVNVLSEISGSFPPVLQMVDEAHIRFDSRKWDEMSGALTVFNSQHRKLKWRVIFGTQFLGLIDKRVKGFAERYHVFKNMFGARKWNFVEMPKRMRELIWTVEPSPSAGPPDEEHWWPLNMEIAACYDTSAGVGIQGGKGAEQRGTRGFKIPWWTIFVALAIGAYGFSQVPRFVANKVMSGFSKFTTAHVPSESQKSSGVKGVHPPSDLRNDFKQNVAGAKAQGNASVTERVWMTGSVVANGRAKAFLSDGRVLNGIPGSWLTDDYCKGPAGEVFWRKPVANPVPTQKKK